MQFRYDIGDKLDLSRFISHAERYIKIDSSNLFDFYMHDFRVAIRVSDYQIASINSKGFFYLPGSCVAVRIYDLKKSGSDIEMHQILVGSDDRFKHFPEIRAMFFKDAQATSIVPIEDSSKIVESACILVTAVHRLGKLKVFL
jgi:hypothetical protein